MEGDWEASHAIESFALTRGAKTTIGQKSTGPRNSTMGWKSAWQQVGQFPNPRTRNHNADPISYPHFTFASEKNRMRGTDIAYYLDATPKAMGQSQSSTAVRRPQLQERKEVI